MDFGEEPGRGDVGLFVPRDLRHRHLGIVGEKFVNALGAAVPALQHGEDEKGTRLRREVFSFFVKNFVVTGLGHPGEGEGVDGETALRDLVGALQFGRVAEGEGQVVAQGERLDFGNLDALPFRHGDRDGSVGAAPEDGFPGPRPISEPAVIGLHGEKPHDSLLDDGVRLLGGFLQLRHDGAELLGAEPGDEARSGLLDAAIGIGEQEIDAFGGLDKARVGEGQLDVAVAVEQARGDFFKCVGEVGAVFQAERVRLAQQRKRIPHLQDGLDSVAETFVGERTDFSAPLRLARLRQCDGERNGLGRARRKGEFHDFLIGAGSGIGQVRGNDFADRGEENSVGVEGHRDFDFLGFLGVVVQHRRDVDLIGQVGEAGERGLDDERLVDKERGLGLAEMLVRQLGGEVGSVPATPGDFRLPASRPAGSVASLPTESIASLPSWSSPADFARDVWPHAERAARKLNVAPEAILAQAALETGWGRHVMPRSDGSSSLNLFGIKAGSGWQGGSVSKPTIEYEEGVARLEVAKFRAYPDVAATFDDYAELIGDHPRYAAARNLGGDAAGFAQALQDSGYATDPAYAKKIENVMNGETMREALRSLKNHASGPIQNGYGRP